MIVLLNGLLIAGILIASLILLYLRMSRRLPEQSDEKLVYTLEAMTSFIKEALHEMTSSSLIDFGLSEEEYRRRKNKRAELKKALRGCTSGDLRDKAYVKLVIADLLDKRYVLSDENLNQLLPFDDPPSHTPQDQFDILLHLYKKQHRAKALDELIRKYELDRAKRSPDDEQSESYRITAEEIRDIYEREAPMLSAEDKTQIVVQRIYQQYKGFSVIDDIRDMKIDGVSGGVSGIPPAMWEGFDEDARLRDVPKSHDSVWLFYKGKSIHLSFLSFGSEQELRRICQNIYKHNFPGQLSEANGFKVNEMADGSRVVVLRPRFSESWAFFVRKFDVQSATLEQLIQDDNAELPIGLIRYLVMGERITAITGAQGSGKTTLLMAMVRYISAFLPIRVQEMSFELQLRKIYRDRNILSLRETETISGQDGLDIQKKTDGSVNILGEVATDPVAAWMVQMAQVASLFTLFTHHAKSFRDLVFSLRNSLLKTKVFTNERIAEQQVVSVVNFDIHLRRDADGHRYIERITECVPTEQELAYPEAFRDEPTTEAKWAAFMETMLEYFRRTTDRPLYEARNVIEYRDGQYVALHPLSEHSRKDIAACLSGPDQAAFEAFMAYHWGMAMKLEWLSLLLGAATVLFLAAVAAFQWLSRHGADTEAIRQYEALRKPGKAQKKQALHSFMQQLYVACERVPFLRAYLLHIRKQMTILQLGDEWKLRLETMKTALFIWGVLLAAAVPLAIGVRDPATLGMIGIGFWVGHGILSDNLVHRLDTRLLRQLRLFLSDVRHHYHRHGMVEEAIYEAADGAPYEMALHGQQLYDVLTASDAEERLAQYIERAPNRYLQGMAGLSHLVKEYGDKRTATGSMYLKSLGKLATELNLELLRREKLGFLLQGLTAIALLPLIFTRPIESWASRYFPAMDAFYASTTGWFVKLGLMAVVWLSYVLLRNIQELDASLKPTSRKRWEKRVYEWAWMRWLAHRLAPAPGSREADRMVKLLKESASPLRLEWLVVQRIVAGGLAFVAVIGMFVALHAANRHQIMYAPVKPGMLFGKLSPAEEAKAREAAALDRHIIQSVKGVRHKTEETMMALLRSELPASNQNDLRVTARRILSKLSMLDGEYVKWWEVFLALLASWGGYALPVGIRLFQRRMRQMEMKHEVDQLHAIIAMLADMDRMSVEHLLIWMEQFARVFKEPLQTCLLHFEHGAEQALAQLKEDAPFLPFVRTVEKLEQAVQSLPIREAFDDLESEQAYAQEQRKQEYEQLIEQKAGWGKWIGFAPMMALIFGYLVIPLVLVSLHQMSVYYEQLQRIQ